MRSAKVIDCLNQINTRENPLFTPIDCRIIYCETPNITQSSNQIEKSLAQDCIRQTLSSLSQQAVSGHTFDVIGKAVAASQLMAAAPTGEFIQEPSANQSRLDVPVQCRGLHSRPSPPNKANPAHPTPRSPACAFPTEKES
ncbi:hypothetical protein [Hydrogenophaga flava]|uniref:hypothetical protein n=1 Tax=Hydrogenophaga flava TaxID=65657 RepID=UPI0012FCD66E|nr:hypothetical protein [Hydrogenophaga flava]